MHSRCSALLFSFVFDFARSPRTPNLQTYCSRRGVCQRYALRCELQLWAILVVLHALQDVMHVSRLSSPLPCGLPWLRPSRPATWSPLHNLGCPKCSCSSLRLDKSIFWLLNPVQVIASNTSSVVDLPSGLLSAPINHHLVD